MLRVYPIHKTACTCKECPFDNRDDNCMAEAGCPTKDSAVYPQSMNFKKVRQ